MGRIDKQSTLVEYLMDSVTQWSEKMMMMRWWLRLVQQQQEQKWVYCGWPTIYRWSRWYVEQTMTNDELIEEMQM